MAKKRKVSNKVTINDKIFSLTKPGINAEIVYDLNNLSCYFIDIENEPEDGIPQSFPSYLMNMKAGTIPALKMAIADNIVSSEDTSLMATTFSSMHYVAMSRLNYLITQVMFMAKSDIIKAAQSVPAIVTSINNRDIHDDEKKLFMDAYCVFYNQINTIFDNRTGETVNMIMTTFPAEYNDNQRELALNCATEATAVLSIDVYEALSQFVSGVFPDTFQALCDTVSDPLKVLVNTLYFVILQFIKELQHTGNITNTMANDMQHPFNGRPTINETFPTYNQIVNITMKKMFEIGDEEE